MTRGEVRCHRLALKVEKDGILPFLDTLFRKEDGSLDITVYRKPTHTDHYLDFQSHHPPHVKRGLVRCLYDRARGIISTQDNLQKEGQHLSKVLRQNGYPVGFIRSAAWPPQREEDVQDSLLEEGSSPPLVMLLYTAGISGDIRRVCKKYDMKVIFRSGLSLCLVLTRVKDPLPTRKQSKVVYRISCSCGKVYISETRRRLEMKLKEQQEACRSATLEKSAVAENALKDRHAIKWDETTVVDMARHPSELLLKEAIHINMTPVEECLNRDTGLELPGCWVATLRRQDQPNSC